MKRRLSAIRILAMLTLLLSAATAKAQEPVIMRDSIRTSLVTCAPGSLIYEVYGHTAIRVQNFTKGIDIVFNYGMFDFNSPHFLWRWLKGETDYFVDAFRWDGFLAEYMQRGSSVYVQELNLSNEGHERLASLLVENCKPENRMYRYDFLSNNCATMALDKIEEAFAEEVSYNLPDSALSFRSLLHQYNGVEPWNLFGVDMVMGADADITMKERQEAFAPMRLMQMAGNAVVTDTAGIGRPMVCGMEEIRPQHQLEFPDILLTPAQVMILVFLLTLLICSIEWNIQKSIWLFDILLFGLQGLAGLLIGFLYFFSSHPTADSNWLIIFLNPLPLLCLPFLIHNLRKHRVFLFLPLNFIICLAFIIFSGLIPQYIHPAVLIMAATFALRSLSDMHLAMKLGRTGERIWQLWRKYRNRPAKAAVVAVALSMASVPSAAGTPGQVKSESRPKLVVGIVIDQLDRDYVERLMPLFGDDGFKKLWYQGFNCTDAVFEYDCPDRASAVASIYTGTVPYYHGIVSEKWMERRTGMLTGAVDDSEESGINTIDHCSPKRLQVTSFADEMKLASDGRSKVCSVAANNDAAVLAGGHEADVVLWMNNSDGQWSSSGYYGGFPSWANEMNNKQLTKNEWKPVFPAAAYVNDHPEKPFKAFSYTFGRGDIWTCKTSPVANDAVTQMAIESFKSMQLGKHDDPDMLAITLYAGPFIGGGDSSGLLEIQDTYVRLDQNIADIIRTITGSVGLKNVVFFVTSTGCRATPANTSRGMRMPVGTVSTERVSALLNLYLSAIYPQGQYISTYYDNNLYLNRSFIEDRKLSLQKISEDCVDFLMQMSGIRSVVTQRDLISGNLSEETLRRRNAINFYCSGDIIFEITPGWTLTDEQNHRSRTENRSSSTFPLLMYGAGIHSEVRHDAVSISSLVPTLSGIIGIPVPEACSALPITNIQ